MKKEIESFILPKLESGCYSGCQVLVAAGGEVLADLSRGSLSREGNAGPVTEKTLFNLESITKVMVTLPLAFMLIQEGRLCLDDRVADVIPEFGTDGDKKGITVRNMLTFTAGIPLEDPEGSEEAAGAGDMDLVWDLHFRQPLAARPGTVVRYSDVSCRILGKFLERVMGMDLAEASGEYIFGPLGIEDTMFNPPCRERCASTGTAPDGRDLTGGLTQGLEHDMGGVLGSDGLFSTAHDMLAFSRMLMGGGTCGRKRILGRRTVERMTKGISDSDVFERPSSYLHYILSGPKTWFWEYGSSPYSFFGDLVSELAIGKMGGAGTFLLLDPAYDLVIIYLTNYGQPESTLAGDAAWNKFQKEIDMMGLCNLVIGNLDV